MGKINWKVRFKNPQFIASLVVSFFVPILGYAGITAEDLTSWAKLFETTALAVTNPYVLALVGVSVYNAVIDPTTAGVKDSKQALSYDKPKKEE